MSVLGKVKFCTPAFVLGVVHSITICIEETLQILPFVLVIRLNQFPIFCYIVLSTMAKDTCFYTTFHVHLLLIMFYTVMKH